MEELLNLLRDGHSRSIEMLAAELNTNVDDIIRRIEFLERAGMIRRVLNIKNNSKKCCSHDCTSCSNCKAHACKSGSSHCKSCLPEGGL